MWQIDFVYQLLHNHKQNMIHFNIWYIFLLISKTLWYISWQSRLQIDFFLCNTYRIKIYNQIQYSKKMMDCNNKCFWHSMRFHMFFIFFLAIYFSRSSQSSSCYQQRQQLLQWPLQCHVECAQLFRNHWISDLLQKGYSKYYLQQKFMI